MLWLQFEDVKSQRFEGALAVRGYRSIRLVPTVSHQLMRVISAPHWLVPQEFWRFVASAFTAADTEKSGFLDRKCFHGAQAPSLVPPLYSCSHLRVMVPLFCRRVGGELTPVCLPHASSRDRQNCAALSLGHSGTWRSPRAAAWTSFSTSRTQTRVARCVLAPCTNSTSGGAPTARCVRAAVAG